MPHFIADFQPVQSAQAAKAKGPLSREVRQLHIQYNKTKNRFPESTASKLISQTVKSRSRRPITKLVSLGLGSLKSVDQSRRFKQLAIFLAIAEQLQQNGTRLDIYAQDPSFSKTDESFLQSLGIQILSTPSPTNLGDAAQYIDESTLVYSPFLTLEAYELLFSSGTLSFFIGDDFDALRNKWPKHSASRNEAESLLKRFVKSYRKRAITIEEGFWEETDKSFPMAIYTATSM